MKIFFKTIAVLSSFFFCAVLLLTQQACNRDLAQLSPAPPTNTPTAVPTSTPTNVPTNTPGGATTPNIAATYFATCTQTSTPALIADMEQATTNTQVLANECRNGYWGSGNDLTAGGVMAITVVAGGAGNGCSGISTNAESVTANAGFTGWGDNFGLDLISPSADFNASGYTGIQFCAKLNSPASLGLNLEVQDNASVTASVGGHKGVFTFTNAWASYSVSFATLSANGNVWGGPTVFNPAMLRRIQWDPPGATAYQVLIDNVSFY